MFINTRNLDPLFLVCLLVCGCASRSVDQADAGVNTPPTDWPEEITFKWLDGPRLHTLAQQVYAEPSDEVLAEISGPGILTREYAGVHDPISNHGLSVRVVYNTSKNVFWLYTPCASVHHVHGYVGPFKGDPRIVLDPVPDDLSQRTAPPDPFVGIYTAFEDANLVAGGGAAYLIEHAEFEHAIAIIKKDATYEISIEPGLRLQTNNRFALSPVSGERGVSVRWIVADLPYDGLRLQDWRFSPGFVLLRGVGPATFGTTGSKTGEDRSSDWSHQIQERKEGGGWTESIGKLTHKGQPIAAAMPGSLIITPIGKFMFIGGAGHRSDGWFNEHKGEPLFDTDGSLTEAGREARIYLKKRNR